MSVRFDGRYTLIIFFFSYHFNFVVCVAEILEAINCDIKEFLIFKVFDVV